MYDTEEKILKQTDLHETLPIETSVHVKARVQKAAAMELTSII